MKAGRYIAVAAFCLDGVQSSPNRHIRRSVNERDMEISMTTHIALFRSLNVGGKNVIKMTALTALFAECGAVNARAYIQSGNILFESARAEAVLGGVSKALRDDHKIDVPVTLRSVKALREVLAKNPFSAADGKLVLVMVLEGSVSPESTARIDLQRSPPDAIHIQANAREVYLHCPNGIAKTKYTNVYLDRALGSPSTGRNLNTVGALLTLAST